MSLYAEQLADLALGLDPRKCPADVLWSLKLLVADSLACTLGGAQVEFARRAAGVLGAPGQVYVPGLSAPRSLQDAVYLGGFCSNVLDYDDTYDGHPGCTIVPPAFALAQSEKASGAEFLAAVLAGYECSLRVAESVRPSPQRRKLVRGVSTWHIFGAAAAAARLLRLDRGQAAHAIASAAISAPVPAARKAGFTTGRVAWLKNNMGLAAWAGVLASLLAREGYQTELSVFEGESGFWQMMASDRYSPCPTDDGRYLLERISLKPYPACRFIHPTIDGLLDLMARGATGPPAQLESVLISTFFEVADYFVYIPRNEAEMPFSLPYVVAMVLTGRPMPYEWYRADNLKDPIVQHIMGRVRAEVWAEADAAYAATRDMMARIAVATGSRQVFAEVRVPLGDPRRPLTNAGLRAKFDGLLAPVVGGDRSARAWKTMMRLEEESDLANLASLLIPH